MGPSIPPAEGRWSAANQAENSPPAAAASGEAASTLYILHSSTWDSTGTPEAEDFFRNVLYLRNHLFAKLKVVPWSNPHPDQRWFLQADASLMTKDSLQKQPLQMSQR